MTTKNLSILIATGLYPPDIGGPANHTILLEKELPKRGWKVRTASFRFFRKFPRIVRHSLYFDFLFLKAFGSRIVYAQDTVSVGFPALLVSKLLRKKFVVRVPGDYAWEQARARHGVLDSLEDFQTKRYGFFVEFLRSIQRRVVQGADLVIVPSDYMKGIVSGWGVEPQTVYSSIDMPLSYELPKKRPEGFLIVSAGRRVPWKGFEALESVVQKEKDWHLFIASDLSKKEALGWIKTADVFVLNSTYEGLSHVLIETMSLDTPIITTNIGGNPELIEDGINGILIPSNDDKALYQAIKNVYEDSDVAERRAQEAQKKSSHFSVDFSMNRLEELLQKL
ncbi:hypothetical protein CL654_02945 [bacterium]|nr:hypothetical protein [bacterium]|tara:strand:- start:38908 stop:39918 length:1011 start_codon:yes stop_codon:yes gene_type:complete